MSRSTAMSVSPTTKLATMIGWLLKKEPLAVSAVEVAVVLMETVLAVGSMVVAGISVSWAPDPAIAIVY